MKKLLPKSLVLLAVWYTLLIASGCLPCRCPQALPYYDLSDFTATPGLYSNQEFQISLEPTSQVFLADMTGQKSCNHFSLNSLMACSCQEAGYLGMKYPVDSVHIYSDQPWNDSLPAGSDLAHLFSLKAISSGSVIAPLNQTQINPEYYFAPVFSSTILPDSIQSPHTFEVVLKKSNNVSVSSFSAPYQFY